MVLPAHFHLKFHDIKSLTSTGKAIVVTNSDFKDVRQQGSNGISGPYDT